MARPPMQHVLQISRKIDYALRAMIHLASLPGERVVPLQEIVTATHLPRDFLAKILKELTGRELVRSVRGAHGGYRLARPAKEISFLEVIEAAEGPVQLNVCLDHKDRCEVSASCTMYHVWQQGQERMLEVYRSTSLADLNGSQASAATVPVPLGLGTSLLRTDRGA